MIEIIELTEQEIEHYALSYDAGLLRVGMKVLCDDELYVTADEIADEIATLSESLKKYDWTDAEEKQERLEMLKTAFAELNARG